MSKIIICLVIILLPAAICKLTELISPLKKLGNITLCFMCGLIIDLLPLQYDKAFSSTIASVIVAIAIPIMLFGINLLDTRKTAGVVAKAFGLQIIAAIGVSAVVALFAGTSGLEYADALSGMTAGLYIGGTPNLIAVGHALTQGNMNVISALVVSDTIVGGIYFLVILSVGKRVYTRILGTSNRCRIDDAAEEQTGTYVDYVDESLNIKKLSRKELLKLAVIVLAAVSCFGIGVLLEIAINGNLEGSLFIIISVSVLGIAGGMIKSIRSVRGSYNLGQYMILAFSVGLGMSIDFTVVSTAILPIFIFCLVVQLGVAVAHMILCKLFHIDAETAIITSIAGIFGPPFVVPVAELLDDKKLMSPGVVCGVVGLSIGNIIGIVVGMLVAIII